MTCSTFNKQRDSVFDFLTSHVKKRDKERQKRDKRETKESQKRDKRETKERYAQFLIRMQWRME